MHTYKLNSSDTKIHACCDGQSKIRQHKKVNGAVSLAPLFTNIPWSGKGGISGFNVSFSLTSGKDESLCGGLNL